MKQQKQQKEYGKKFFVPILLILAVLPLITNAHIYDNGLSKQLWSSANGQVTDFFLYYNSGIGVCPVFAVFSDGSGACRGCVLRRL